MKKPKNKHTLTLHFDTKVGIANFIAWYLDGGGEQYSHYYSDSWGKDWMYVKPPDNACPHCEYSWDEDDNNNRASQNTHLKKIATTCLNCGKKYMFDNAYFTGK